MKTFESRKELNRHIVYIHKKELNEITKSKDMDQTETVDQSENINEENWM